MKNKIIALTTVIIFVFLTLSLYGASDNPERMFNAANEAMVKGNDAFAIELYYRLLDDHPKFKSYRDDVFYRLGSLLYKTERFDEAEKILQLLVNKHKDYPRIKKVYEKLMHIYVQELGDDVKAQKIRNIYAKQFGSSSKLKAMDKTMTILNYDEKKASRVLSLLPKDIVIGDVSIEDSFDKEFFPVRNYVKQNVKSTSGKYSARRKVTAKGRYLYIKDLEKNKEWKVDDSKRGFAPVWSWDSKYLFFTSAKGKTRDIRIYDVKRKTTRTLFSGRNIEPLLCVSPDASKIVFTYSNRLWVMNRAGSSISLLKRNVKVHNIRLTAWSKGGDSFMLRTGEKKVRYYRFKLKKKELRILK